MVSAFIQDLQSMRDVAQDHRRHARLRSGIVNNDSLSFSAKMDRLIQFNRGFDLPIALPVLNLADDGIDGIIFSYNGQILADELSAYTFFEVLMPIAARPYVRTSIQSHDSDEESGRDEHASDGDDFTVSDSEGTLVV